MGGGYEYPVPIEGGRTVRCPIVAVHQAGQVARVVLCSAGKVFHHADQVARADEMG